MILSLYILASVAGFALGWLLRGPVTPAHRQAGFHPRDELLDQLGEPGRPEIGEITLIHEGGR